jgi:hypothetical protein
MRMAQEIGTPDAAAEYVKRKRTNKEAIMGFGHRVYRAEDPRARHMRAGVEQMSQAMGEPKWYGILAALVEAMKPYARHGVNVNVDFYAGVVYFLNGIAEDLFVPIFASGRVPGWTGADAGADGEQHPDPAADALQRARAARVRADRRALTHAVQDAAERSANVSRSTVVATISSTLAPRDRSLIGRAKPCSTGSDRLGARQLLRQLVRDIAGVEIREHQYVRAPRHGTRFLQFLRRDGGRQRGVGLQFAVDGKARRARLRKFECTHRPCRPAHATHCLSSRTTAARRAALRQAAVDSCPRTQARCRRARRATGPH